MASPAEALHVPEPEGYPEDRLHVVPPETDPIVASRARREEAIAIADARHAERMAETAEAQREFAEFFEGMERHNEALADLNRRLSWLEAERLAAGVAEGLEQRKREVAERAAEDAWYAGGEKKAEGGSVVLPPLEVENVAQLEEWKARFLYRRSSPGAASRAAGNA